MMLMSEVLSSEEVVARGVQPYRFEPRRRVCCDDEESGPGDLTFDNVSF